MLFEESKKSCPTYQRPANQRTPYREELGGSCIPLQDDMLGKVIGLGLHLSTQRFCLHLPAWRKLHPTSNARQRKKPDEQAAAAPQAPLRILKHTGTQNPDPAPCTRNALAVRLSRWQRRVRLYRRSASPSSQSPSRARCTPAEPNTSRQAIHCLRDTKASNASSRDHGGAGAACRSAALREGFFNSRAAAMQQHGQVAGPLSAIHVNRAPRCESFHHAPCDTSSAHMCLCKAQSWQTIPCPQH